MILEMMRGNLFREKGFPRTPSKKHSRNNYLNGVVSLRIDSKSQPCARAARLLVH